MVVAVIEIVFAGLGHLHGRAAHGLAYEARFEHEVRLDQPPPGGPV